MDPFTISLFFSPLLLLSTLAMYVCHFVYSFLLSYTISSNIIHPSLHFSILLLMLLLLLLVVVMVVMVLLLLLWMLFCCLFIYSSTVENYACTTFSRQQSRSAACKVYVCLHGLCQSTYYNFLISCHFVSILRLYNSFFSANDVCCPIPSLSPFFSLFENDRVRFEHVCFHATVCSRESDTIWTGHLAYISMHRSGSELMLVWVCVCVQAICTQSPDTFRWSLF